jgi:hypothetical protein
MDEKSQPRGQQPPTRTAERDMDETSPLPGQRAQPGEPEAQSWWAAYWERFRRQTVDEPVEGRHEGLWDRFRRQDVDDPVQSRGGRRST